MAFDSGVLREVEKIRRSTGKQAAGERPGGGSVGGSLVVGIVTVVVVGIAGKLFTKLRFKPRNSPDITAATDYLNKIKNGDGRSSYLLKKVVSNGEDPTARVLEELGDLPPYDAIINGERSSSLDRKAGRSDALDTSNDVSGSNLVSNEIHVPESSVDDQSVSITRDESPSKHELQGKTTDLKDGIADVVSGAFEDLNSYVGLSNDELTPTQVKVTVMGDSKTSEPSEEEAADTSADSTSGESVAGTDNLRELQKPIDHSELAAPTDNKCRQTLPK